MTLGRLSRNAKERNPVRAAIATAFIGIFMLVQGILADREGTGGSVWYVIALIFFALVVPVWRDNDEAEVAVIGIFLLLMALAVFIGGMKILFPWPLVMGVVLWAGMRGVPVQNARPPAPGARGG
jgi:nitrate/nitrite transporter NarK